MYNLLQVFMNARNNLKTQPSMKSALFYCFFLISANLLAQANVDWYNYPGGVALATNLNYDVYTVNWDYNPAGDITLTKRDSSELYFGILL
ncbi:MAG: hypothetical protein IPP38_14320 [Bacteroidetes bacterium]|nr:hypothetical protein [Bacteroidota bacterium]